MASAIQRQQVAFAVSLTPAEVSVKVICIFMSALSLGGYFFMFGGGENIAKRKSIGRKTKTGCRS